MSEVYGSGDVHPDRRSRGGGGKLARSETVTVRLDPKLRYLAELAARRQRRTLSSFIEWAIEESLGHVNLGDGDDPYAVSVAVAASSLWDVDEPDRFARLALRYPDLLTHEEQILWKLIRENGFLWRGRYDRADQWSWMVCEEDLCFDRLREQWAWFSAVARGDADKSSLPRWPRVRPPQSDPKPPASGGSPSSSGSVDLDDDIPF
jgi:hypothetical protein